MPAHAVIFEKGGATVNYKQANMRVSSTGAFEVKEFVKTSGDGEPVVFTEKYVERPSYVASDGYRYLFATGGDENA